MPARDDAIVAVKRLTRHIPIIVIMSENAFAAKVVGTLSPYLYKERFKIPNRTSSDNLSNQGE